MKHIWKKNTQSVVCVKREKYSEIAKVLFFQKSQKLLTEQL